MFSIYRGQPNLFLSALKSRSDICRGALVCLLKHHCLVPYLLEENGQWLFDFIAEKCKKFDTVILKVNFIVYVKIFMIYVFLFLILLRVPMKVVQIKVI